MKNLDKIPGIPEVLGILVPNPLLLLSATTYDPIPSLTFCFE